MRRPFVALIAACSRRRARLARRLRRILRVGRGRDRAEPRRLLDAARGLRGADVALPRDRRGRRRLVRRVVRELGRADAGGHRRPRRRRRRALAGSRPRQARGVGPGRGRLDASAAQRDGHELGRRPRHSSRQPEGDPGLGRSPGAGRRGRHAQPLHLGRRALEHHGGLRRLAEGGQDRRAGAGEPARAVPERRRPGQERPRLAEHVPERQGRRAARVRERGDLLAAPGRGPAVRDPELDDPDREPRRRARGERREGEGGRVPPVPLDAGGADRSSRTTATGRSSSPSSSRTATSCPSSPVSSRSRTSAAGPRSWTGSSTRERESWPRSSARSEAAPGSACRASRQPSGRAARGGQTTGRPPPCRSV